VRTPYDPPEIKEGINEWTTTSTANVAAVGSILKDAKGRIHRGVFFRDIE